MEPTPLAREPRFGRGTQAIGRGWPHAIAFAFVWWMLTEGDRASWLVGIPAVLAAAAAAAAMAPHRVHLSARGLARFVPYFVWRSMAGSLDVAWRTLHPRLPISPAVEEYRLRLPRESPARVFFADVMSLLPGTLSAELREESVLVHLLNSRSPTAWAEVERLERMVGAVFGHELNGTGSAQETPNA